MARHTVDRWLEAPHSAELALAPFIVGQSPLTRGKALERMDRLRALLMSWSVPCGARVLIASRDDASVASLVLGCLVAGMVAVPLDPRIAGTDLQRAAGLTDAAAAFVDVELLDTLDAPLTARDVAIAPERRAFLLELIGRLVGLRGADASSTFPALLDQPADALHEVEAMSPDLPGEAAALLLPSPDGTMCGLELSRDGLAKRVEADVASLGVASSSRILDALPLFEPGGLVSGVILAFATGAVLSRPTVLGVDNLPFLLDRAFREQATHLIVESHAIALMLDMAEELEDVVDRSGVTAIAVVDGRLDTDLRRHFEERFGVTIVDTRRQAAALKAPKIAAV